MAAAGVLGAVPPARLSSSALDRMVQILHDPIAGGVQREVDETLAALQERHARLQNRLGRPPAAAGRAPNASERPTPHARGEEPNKRCTTRAY